MPVQESVTDGLSDLPSQSIYGPAKRLKRGLLRLAGRWSRRHYDVEVVIQQGAPRYKKITFKTAHEAQRTRQALARFGDSQHFPRCHRQADNTIWVDFVRGAPCQRIHDHMMPELAQCFAYIAGHQSRLVDFTETGYGPAHAANLAVLAEHGIADRDLYHELIKRSLRAQPPTLRVGFDYRDPIGPNLLQRRDSGAICAIDVKNLHADTLVGEGLAKAADRWLTPARRRFVLAHFQTLDLGDIARHFEYIALYERATRVRRKLDRDLRVHGRIRQRRRLQTQLASVLALSVD